MVEEQLLAPEKIEAEISDCRGRLAEHYAKKIVT
jgi:hypothetical protein